MGYTHYLNIKGDKLTKKDFNNILSDVIKIDSYIKKNKVLCVTAGSSEGEPIDVGLNILSASKNTVSKSVPFKFVLFGKYESLELNVGKQDCADFIKTNREAYDTAICLALISLNYYTPTTKITSDGDIEEWQGAIDLWHTIFPDRNEFIFNQIK